MKTKMYYMGQCYSHYGEIDGYGVMLENGERMIFKTAFKGLIPGYAFEADFKRGEGTKTTLANWGQPIFEDKHPDADVWETQAKAGRVLAVKIREARD